MEHPTKILQRFAHLVNQKKRKALFQRPFYEVMSGAIIWEDEIDRNWPTELIWSMRAVFAYRTSNYIGKERSDLKEDWDTARKYFPDWVGFSKSRISPSSKIIDLYKRRKKESDAEIDAALDEGKN